MLQRYIQVKQGTNLDLITSPFLPTWSISTAPSHQANPILSLTARIPTIIPCFERLSLVYVIGAEQVLGSNRRDRPSSYSVNGTDDDYTVAFDSCPRLLYLSSPANLATRQCGEGEEDDGESRSPLVPRIRAQKATYETFALSFLFIVFSRLLSVATTVHYIHVFPGLLGW